MAGARVALVTGASRGIGRACAIALARRGLRVAVHYHRDRKAAIECAAMLDGAGREHPVLQADLTQPEEARSLVDAVTRDCGRLDAVVNNAALVGRVEPVLKTAFGDDKVKRLPPITPSEDFAEYASGGTALMFFLVGVYDPRDVEASRQPGGKPLPGMDAVSTTSSAW